MELELAAKTAEVSQANVPPVPQQHANAVEPVFDVHRNMRLVPPFLKRKWINISITLNVLLYP